MKYRCALPLLICLAGPGCRPAAAPTSVTPAAQDRASSPAAAVEQIRLDIRSWQETQQWVAAQRGKVVVLDIWSSWCVPCQREFPHLVELHREYPGRVACVSVNIDYTGSKDQPPASFRDKVHAFLSKQGATFQNVICSDPDLDVLAQLKLGAIPAVLVYDRAGQLQKRFDNDDQQYGEHGVSYREHVVPLVEKLLAEGQN